VVKVERRRVAAVRVRIEASVRRGLALRMGGSFPSERCRGAREVPGFRAARACCGIGCNDRVWDAARVRN
jgi:hypothetical protein